MVEVYTDNYLLLREAFKKKRKKSVTFFTFGGGSGPVFVTLFYFFQKHGLKWLKIAL